MKQYVGQCHCGEIRFQFEAEEITTAMRCSCSICRRRSAFLSNFVLESEQCVFVGDDDVHFRLTNHLNNMVASLYYTRPEADEEQQ